MNETPATSARGRSGPRWLLLGSLALNLFFIGIAVAMLIRTPEPSRWHRDVFVRTERLADRLPSADGAIMRQQMEASRGDIEKAQTRYAKSRDGIREALRREPFVAKALEESMVESRAARQNYDQTMHAFFVNAAAKMSAEGRQGMAARRSDRSKNTGNRKSN